MKEITAIVSGRVQMVMYRDFARRHAQKLGISGTVTNMSDGTVSVMAQGSEQQLTRFIDQLKKGPMLAKVEKVDVSWRELSRSFSDFVIT